MKELAEKIEDILFIDIETVGVCATYKDLSSDLQQFWNHKAKLLARNPDLSSEECATLYGAKGGIYSEFAKVACISIGFLIVEDKEITGIRTKSFYGTDEVQILQDFVSIMDNYFGQPKQQYLCGHNIKEFDIPFLCRRMVINGMPIPKRLDISGMKPWEITHLVDTMTMWKYGDYKNYTSLALLAHVLGIPTPKDDIDGSMVHHVFWDNGDHERIARYCEKDVVTAAKVLLRLANVELPEDLEMISKTDFE